MDQGDTAGAMLDRRADDRATASLPRREYRNRLLAGLAPADLALIEPHLVAVSYSIGDTIAAAGDPIRSVCFPEQGIAGILDTFEGTRTFAVGLVGAEGYIGWPLLLGDDCSPYRVVMRAESGVAHRLPARALLEAVERSAALRLVLVRFAGVFALQMGRTIVSNLAHSIEERMARWILLYHDRVRGDEIRITHEEFGLMLGVRRSSITEALHRLEECRAIRASRGVVEVLDRAQLCAAAGDTYGHAERAYERLLGTGARSAVDGART